ncbi:MAG: S8 family peptidase [Geminicoccaceae bacterium]
MRKCWNIHVFSLALLTSTALSGCGGGSGSAGIVIGSAPTPPPQVITAPPSSTASTWTDQAEYQNQDGLASIRAAQGYANRTLGLEGGAGVRIALIDGAVDRDHPDLAGAVAGMPFFEAPDFEQPTLHATHVAGIMVARRDLDPVPFNMHGVAYNADLVGIAAAQPDSEDSRRGVFFNSDLATALTSAAAISGRDYGATLNFVSDGRLESDIINMSLGGGIETPDLVEAMADAADQGKIMVIAAGNEGVGEPSNPANLATRPEMRGLVIAVGNWDQETGSRGISNACGVQADRCLFAPGQRINSTLAGGGYAFATGTSMATPHVTGAAAVVQAAFPGMSARDVVDRLLATATDLGDPGMDEVFGHGLLNLEQALTPVGSLTIPQGEVVDGPSLALAASELEVSSAFGTGISGSGAFDDALALDAMGFPFEASLGQRVSLVERNSGLESFIGGGSMSHAGLASSFGEIRLGVAEEQLYRDETSYRSLAEHREAETSGAPALSWRLALSEDVEGFVNLEGGAAATAGLMASLHETGAGLFEEAQFLAPYDELAGTVHGAGLSMAAGENGLLSVQGFTASQTEDDPSQLARMDYRYRLSERSALHLGMGSLAEGDGFLGSRASGAFGDDVEGASRYMSFGLSHALSNQATLFGSYTEGRTEVSGGGALGDLSSIRANAFGAGAVIRDVHRQGDGFTVMVGQPLRVYQAEAQVDMAVARTADGRLIRESREVDYGAQGRETFISAQYAAPMGKKSQLELGMMVRMQPNHDPNAETDIGVGARYQIRF